MYIKVYKNKSELEGTAYIELLAGPYKNKCWVKGSLFFDEEIFSFFEPSIKKHVPKYDHYAFTEIDFESCRRILAEFCLIVEVINSAESVADLEQVIGFEFRDSKDDFAIDFTNNKLRLINVVIELIEWFESAIKKYKTVSILGI